MHSFWPVTNLSLGSFDIFEGCEHVMDNLFQAPVLQRLNIRCQWPIYVQVKYSNDTRAIPVLHIQMTLNVEFKLSMYASPMRKTSILLMEIVDPDEDRAGRPVVYPRKKGLDLEVITIQNLWEIYNTNDMVFAFPPITQRILTVIYISGFYDHSSLTADEISQDLLVETVIGARVKMLFDWYIQKNGGESMRRWLASLYVVWDMTQWSRALGEAVAPVSKFLRRLNVDDFNAACIQWIHDNCQLDEFFQGWIETNQLILMPSTPDTERHIRDTFLTIPLRPHVPYHEHGVHKADDQQYFYRGHQRTNVEE